MRSRFLVIGLLALALAGEASAAGPQGKTFGLGLELGDPSGFNAKYWMDSISALDFRLGYEHMFYHWHGFSLGAGYLYHAYDFKVHAPFRLLFYVGGGGKLLFWDDHYHDYDDDGFGIGIRVPFGLTMILNRVPFDVFLEFAPGFTFLFGHDDHYYDQDHDWFDVDVSLGGRFYF